MQTVTPCLPYSGIRKGISKSFQTQHQDQEWQVVQLSVIRRCSTTVFKVSLLSSAATNLCAISQRVFTDVCA